MSWISDIVGKAENILLKVDENVATALLQPTNKQASSSVQSLLSLSPIKINISGGTENVLNDNQIASNTNVPLPTREYDETLTLTTDNLPCAAPAVAIDINNDQTLYLENSKSNDVIKQHISLETNNMPETVQSTNIQPFGLANLPNELSSPTLNSTKNLELQQRIIELDTLVERLTEERDQSLQRIYESEKICATYLHSISQLEANLAKLQQEYFDALERLQTQTEQTQKHEQELQEYRIKAQRALLNKDNLIAELKAKGANFNTNTTVTAEANSRQTEYESLKQIHEHTLLEQQKLLYQLEEARNDLNTFCQTNTEQLKQLRENEDLLRKELRTERERLLATESEQRVLSQELNNLRQQLSNQLAALTTRLQQKDMELERLRTDQLKSKVINHENIEDYDKIKTLTQALVSKQSAVEDITAERNALRIQLEKVQDQLQQEIYNNKVYKNTIRNPLLSNSTDDVKAQYPALMRENPFDRSVARRVKRAYTTLDSAGIRLGTFLRRYPLIRIFVLIYIGLLHIWVMFVLLSSTPNN